MPPCTVRNASDGASALLTVLSRGVESRAGSSVGPSPVTTAVAALASACLCIVGTIKLADTTTLNLCTALPVIKSMLPVCTGGDKLGLKGLGCCLKDLDSLDDEESEKT